MRLSSTRTVTAGRADVALPAPTRATAAITISGETFCISSPSGIEKGRLASLRRTVGRVIGAGTGLVSVAARKCGVDARFLPHPRGRTYRCLRSCSPQAHVAQRRRVRPGADPCGAVTNATSTSRRNAMSRSLEQTQRPGLLNPEVDFSPVVLAFRDAERIRPMRPAPRGG